VHGKLLGENRRGVESGKRELFDAQRSSPPKTLPHRLSQLLEQARLILLASIRQKQMFLTSLFLC
jgi:hypothetical protein